MVWTRAATVIIDRDGHYLDADEHALELLGVESVEVLRQTSPEAFAAAPQDPEEAEAWRQAYFSSRAEGVLAEGAFRRTDGELVRVRTGIMEQPDGTFRAMFYPLERPTTNLTARTFRISDVLSEWRAAERRLSDVDVESEEGRKLAADVELLRQQYQQLFARSREQHGG